jgi:YD repeat-containing protein
VWNLAEARKDSGVRPGANKYLWGRVAEKTLEDGQVYRYEYRLQGRDVVQARVTLPSGEEKTFGFEGGHLVGVK